jgi:ATP-dependent Clp protease ATP-binding subunit ClpC
MSLDKLTERAKEAILKISPGKTVKSGDLLKVLSRSSGMSGVLLQLFPKIKINKEVNLEHDMLVKEAYYQAMKLEHPYVGTEHLLLALLKLTSSGHLEAVRIELARMNVFPNAVRSLEKGNKTPILDSFGENLNNKLFREFDKPLAVREEYNSLISVLLQKNNANPLLVGEKGVGKNSIIELLAQNINFLNVPPSLVGYQVIEFDLLAFMTNAFNKNSLELVLASFIEELKSVDKVILSIKNFQNIFFATSVGFTVPVFYSMFKSSLEAHGVKFIATMNTSLYEKIISENEHILDSISVIEVSEPKEELTKEIIRLNAMYLGKFHNVEISPLMINYVYKKAKEEIKEVKFPQKGLDLLDQACSRLIMKKRVVPDSYKDLVDRTFIVVQSMDKNIESGDYETAAKNRKKLKRMENSLLEEERQIFYGRKLKLTVKEVDEALKDFGVDKKFTDIDTVTGTLGGLAKKIKKQIIGQNEAVDTVVRSLIRAKLGLRSKKRPMGNFLFLGPTGVGKTELAKVLAENAFAHGENGLIRLDMSDFGEKHNVARLVGAPPGYVGYGEGGELTQKIELQPESVVLFDEIEKAHPDVLNILLQIMEEGELSDAKGNTFDFSKAIIILTSNLGTEFLHTSGIGFEEKAVEDTKMEGRLKSNLKKILKPELINRFDEVIVFKRLSKDDQLSVLDLLVEEIEGNLKNQKVSLKVAASARKYLLDLGYSAEYGARSLRRIVEKELLDKIAEVLLKSRKRPLTLEVRVYRNKLAVKAL